MSNIPPCVVFSGPSGSGKTTLVEKVIARLSSNGLKVGAIKKSHHKVDIDKPGKDSFRFREAGANPTVITSSGFTAFMESTPEPPPLSTLLARFEGKADIVIVEGYKDETFPMLAFASESGGVPKGAAGLIIADPHGGKLAEKSVVPMFHRDDVDGIVNWIFKNIIPNFKERADD